jgi:dipeptidyl aminopeptidase/acylaminoacyl peptidase
MLHQWDGRDETRSEQPAPAPRRDITFASGGVACRAWLYTPAGPRPAPLIVMAHGLAGTRRCGLEPFAEKFAAAGFFVLVFDYRRLGDSGGSPRQLINIRSELEDWAAAVACARGLPGVDAARIALWGTSLSGGHVVVAAARDGGIAAVSAQCPWWSRRRHTQAPPTRCSVPIASPISRPGSTRSLKSVRSSAESSLTGPRDRARQIPRLSVRWRRRRRSPRGA